MIALQCMAPAAAVQRTLQAIANMAGCTVADDAAHRLQLTETALQLWHGEQLLQQWPLPAHPAEIAWALQQPGQPEQRHAHALAGGWQFDAAARHLQHAQAGLDITEKEAALLAALLAAYPAPCPREQLLHDIWGMQADAETHTLETHMYRLRHKLGELQPKPCDIVTTDSAYQLTLEPTA